MTIYKKIFLLIIFLAIVCIILLYIKNALLYHPLEANQDKYNKFYQKLYQLVEFKTDLSNHTVKTLDSILLDTIYLKNPDNNKCIIFFHGNAGNISMRFDIIKFLYNYASIIIFDYRSFGKSMGSSTFITASSLQTDAEAIWNFAVYRLGIDPNNISFFGESLGCAIAIALAANLSKTMDSRYYPHSIICNAPFSSLASMIETMFSKINLEFVGKIIGPFFSSEYKSDHDIKYINHQTKIILAHSPRDEVIPYNEGQRLYNTIANVHPDITFINITGTHNNLGLTDQYIYGLANLFND